MKEIQNKTKTNFIKKLFIKLCRILGYEIIDQNKFYIPTSEKSINDTISIQGQRSINLPLGEVKITRKVKSLDIIIRTCASVNMLTQNKDRIFQKDKIDYILRSINSILRSIDYAMQNHSNISFNILIVDYNSSKENLHKIKSLLENSGKIFKIFNLDILEFENRIKKINQKNERSTSKQLSNMCNIYKSLELSKASNDLIYFVEDDYIHKIESISEMIFTYERIASLTSNELILCPSDYPYLYAKASNTKIFLGENYHWRKVDETLCTFLMSKKTIEKHWKKLINMCEIEHYPFESPLHEIYKEELCISPVPSLAVHFTNINSIFGLSPNIDWQKLWDENKN
tara:strand:+ start:2708 stop:3736 length:1029 start_codon:yes stop_codon:yes gene_type:complete